MSKSVLIFFPLNPYPPRSGAHRRFLEMATGFSSLGYRVTLLSSTFTSETEWTRQSIEQLKYNFGLDVRIHVANAIDCYPERWLSRLYRGVHIEPPLNSAVYTSPLMRLWFRRQCQELQPDVIVMNYSRFDGLLSRVPRSSSLRVMDSIDLLTLNEKMRRALSGKLPTYPEDQGVCSEDVLNEKFFIELGLEADPAEFRVFDKYDFTIAISQNEAELVKKNTMNTKVVCIPMTAQSVHVNNRYDGPAVFVTGPNPFNLQGYLYWAKRVLPFVQRVTAEFQLRVTGTVCDCVAGQAGVILDGFVPDLEPVYESARFAICPVFGGTGQQIKIVEAMAHGVPVVALQAAAESSPIQHEVNGLVAVNAEEFAEHCLRLWNDRELCRKLGVAARDTIAGEFGRDRLHRSLAELLS